MYIYRERGVYIYDIIYIFLYIYIYTRLAVYILKRAQSCLSHSANGVVIILGVLQYSSNERSKFPQGLPMGVSSFWEYSSTQVLKRAGFL